LVPEVPTPTSIQATHVPREAGPPDRRLRLSGRLFVGSFVLLAVVTILAFLTSPSFLDAFVALLVAALGLATLVERRAVAALEARRHAESESFTRILSGLSRSVSPDAIVAAIVEELGSGTDADHVVVVRRRPELRSLEATLHVTRHEVAPASTMLPLSDLDDPAEEEALAASAVTRLRHGALDAMALDDGPTEMTLWDERVVAPSPADVVPLPVTTSVRHRPHVTSIRDGAGARIAERIALRVGSAYGLTHTLAAPLRVDGRVEGAIVLSRRTAGVWPVTSVRLLEAAAAEASAALTRVYSLRQAETRASTDALTGLPNRRYFDEYVGLLASRRRAEDRLGLLMIDVDRFKRLNDTFGHAIGDHVLRAIAGAIAGAVREDDVPSRFGGEEFAVLLRNPSEDIAVEVGERVRRAVAALDLRRLGVPGVSVSVGVAVAARPGATIDGLIEDADRALYRAKRSGRDRVVAA
jgi:diguanylate cyclase (GGDEF)-like protein